LPGLRNIFAWVGAWKFDLATAVLTIVVAPIITLLLRAAARHLKAWISYLWDGLLYWLSRFVFHSLASRLSLRQYCRALLQADNRYLYVPSQRDIKLPVDEIFVTLQLEHYGGERETYTHLDLVTLGNRIRVMGDPGSGKTSLTKKIFRDQCRLGVAKPTKARLPLYMELKTLAIPTSIKDKDLGDWLFSHIRNVALSVKVYRVDQCFESCLTATGLLILLDGLDEVSRIQYPRVSRAIQLLSNKLAAESRNTVVVLTMRTQFYHQIKEDFRDAAGQAVFVRPFKPTDIFEFLTRWPFSKATRDDFLTQIYKDLTDRPTLREMCSNPLVLAMYVAEYESAPTPVAPESRTEFYRRVTEELLIKRRLKQTGKAPAPGKLREQRERILGRLAYEHLMDPRQPSNSLRWTDAIKTTKAVMKCESDEAEAIFREVAKETGLVSEERPRESLRFIHLTFCEFLAAFEAAQGQKDGWGALMKANVEFQREQSPQTHSRLLEVIPFAAGLMPRVRRQDIMEDVCRIGSFRLAARSFLETKAYEYDSWQSFVVKTRQTLLETPETDWNEQWLRDLHLFNVIVRDQHQCAEHSPSAGEAIDLGEFYKTLVSRQQNSLSSLLTAYAAQDAAAVFRLAEVCELDLLVDYPKIIIDNLDQNPFFELVLHHALRDHARFDLWAVLLAEAALRSGPVARKLMAVGSTAALAERIARIPRRKRWVGFGLDGLYGQIITVAMEQPAAADSARSVLKLVRPCSNLVRACSVVSWIPIFCFSFAPAIVLSAQFGRGLTDFKFLVFLSALGLALLEITSWLTAWPRFYREALNIPREKQVAFELKVGSVAATTLLLLLNPQLTMRRMTTRQRAVIRRLNTLRGTDGGHIENADHLEFVDSTRNYPTRNTAVCGRKFGNHPALFDPDKKIPPLNRKAVLPAQVLEVERKWMFGE
jgi:hypothetical protein